MNIEYVSIGQGIGYNDFSRGIESLQNYLTPLQSEGVKILCANVNTTEEVDLHFLIEKSWLFNVKGTEHKIGIIGFIGADSHVSSKLIHMSLNSNQTNMMFLIWFVRFELRVAYG